MRTTKVYSAAIWGGRAFPATVTCEYNPALGGQRMPGINEDLAKQVFHRARHAVEAAGLTWPVGRLTVSVECKAPVNWGVDLAVTAAIMGASEDTLFFGPIDSKGVVGGVSGVTCVVNLTADLGVSCVVPRANWREAACAMVEGQRVFTCETFGSYSADPVEPWRAEVPDPAVDFSEVRGQKRAKRALEIAAAGGFNILLEGAPGSGKTMLARRVPTILPPMNDREIRESSAVHSAAGIMAYTELPVVNTRPFRAPHYTISQAGVWGHRGNPGEVNLAHNGVLFLDDLPEFSHRVTDPLRCALRDGATYTAATKLPRVYIPARPAMVVGAKNPCPCGFHGAENRKCQCTDSQIKKFRERTADVEAEIFDLKVEVAGPTYADLLEEPRAESSAAILERVTAARQILAPLGRKPTVAEAIAALDGRTDVTNEHRAEAATFAL